MLRGTVTHWNDTKGIGTITSATGSERTFVHIEQFQNRSRRPVIGDEVTYELAQDSQGRINAVSVRYVGDRPRLMGNAPRESRKPGRGFIVAMLLPVFAAYFVYRLANEDVSVLVLLAYAVLSRVAFVEYRSDKVSAIGRTRRTPESKLIGLAMIGGWPGAFLAQKIYRHKTSKPGFQAAFTAAAIANALAFVLLTTPELRRGGRVLPEEVSGSSWSDGTEPERVPSPALPVIRPAR